jgi:hypothetical protein
LTLAIPFVAGALVLASPLTARAQVPPPAGRPVPVQISNGDLSQPAQEGTTWSGGMPAEWGGRRANLVSAVAAQHPGHLQAVALSDRGVVYTRLWGARKGAPVTLTFDDSPSTYGGCAPEQLRQQSYTVAGTGTPGSRTFTPSATAGTGRNDWHRDRTFTFTPSQDQPEVRFTAVADNGPCGPMVANVRATRLTRPLNTSIPKTELPAPQALSANDAADLATLVDDCDAGPNRCLFTDFGRYSYAYFDRPRVIGEAFLNCTGKPVVDSRTISYTEGPYDSISQEYSRRNVTLDPPGDISRSRPNLAGQLARGFESFAKSPWAWSAKHSVAIALTVPPGEAGWVEVQPARERVEGYFTSIRNENRLFTQFDAPSAAHSDRVYLRTAPMTQDERAGCAAGRRAARPARRAAQPAAALSVALESKAVPLPWLPTR